MMHSYINYGSFFFVTDPINHHSRYCFDLACWEIQRQTSGFLEVLVIRIVVSLR